MERTKNDKPAIAVDLDDVVFPCAEGLVAAYNEHYGTNFRHDVPQSTWDVPQKKCRSDLMDCSWGRHQAWRSLVGLRRCKCQVWRQSRRCED